MNQPHPSKRSVDWIALALILASVGLVTVLILWRLAHSPEQNRDVFDSARAAQQVRQIVQAVKSYQADHADLPVSLQALVPKYLDHLSVDPWGHPYVYQRYEKMGYITCYGKDGRPRGYGVDLDIIATLKKP